MSILRSIALAVAVASVNPLAHALGDLSPGSGLVGAGNLAGGPGDSPVPGGFSLDHAFIINWGDSPVAPGDRLTDIVGQVHSYQTSYVTGLSPFEFTAIELLNDGGTQVLQRHFFVHGEDQIDFTFARLLEGSYRIRFFGQANPMPPDGWAVAEWTYSFQAVASPAPEPHDLAMAALGLSAVGFWVRRKGRAASGG